MILLYFIKLIVIFVKEIFRIETKEEVLREFGERIMSGEHYVSTCFDYLIIEIQYKNLTELLTKKLGYNVEYIFIKDFKSDRN